MSAYSQGSLFYGSTAKNHVAPCASSAVRPVLPGIGIAGSAALANQIRILRQLGLSKFLCDAVDKVIHRFRL